MNTDTAPCRVCQGVMYGPWCSECEAWTGIPPASDEMVAEAKKEDGTKVSGWKTVALIKRIEQEQAKWWECDACGFAMHIQHVDPDSSDEQCPVCVVSAAWDGLTARDDLLQRALPWLEDEAGALASCVEAMAHESPQSSRGVRELAEMSDLITDIKARVTGRASNGARNQGESADAPGANLDAGPADEIHETGGEE